MGLFDGIAGAVGGIAKATKTTAKKSVAPKRKASAPRRVVNNGVSGVNRIGRATARASQPRRTSSNNASRNTGVSRNAGYAGRSQTPARISRPATGATPGGAIAPTVPAPVVPKFDQAYLSGDTAYSAQKAAYDKALADFATRSSGELQNYGTEYNSKLTNMQKAQDQGALDLKDDYASRGLLSSGVYGDALNDFNNSYTTQRDELARAKQQYESDLANSKTDFTTEQQTLLQKAKQDALNRYNDKYKV